VYRTTAARASRVSRAHGRGASTTHTGPEANVIGCPAVVVNVVPPPAGTSQRLAAADQVNVNDAEEYPAERDVAGRPPDGAGPNRKPMSWAVLAPRASASSWAGRAYRLYGAGGP
jgi:hypothetical protein